MTVHVDADFDSVEAHDDPTESLRLLVHDLRQPVVAMCLLLNVMCDREDVPADLAVCLGQLDRYATWLGALLRDALAPAPPAPRASSSGQDGSARRRTQRTRRVALNCLAVESASSVGQSRPVRMVVECERPVWVRVCETSLRRALNNVLDNACKAAGPGGTVRLRVGEDNASGFVQVDDDGPGFGRVASGTQLGLLVVTQVTLDAGGRLELSTSDLGGTSVTLRLPAAARPRVGAAS